MELPFNAWLSVNEVQKQTPVHVKTGRFAHANPLHVKLDAKVARCGNMISNAGIERLSK